MLAAAVATWLLTYATTYPTCWSPRSASASPAARSRSASPMSRAGTRPEKQGTALGIFGAGNVGAAVTKFVAPFVLVAYGWQTVAQVWAVARGHGGRLLVLRPRTIRSSRAPRHAARSRAAWLSSSR
jgi:MFS transporter, NNP family, nitrate/nitrite transporter